MVTSNISRYTTGESYPRALKIIGRIAKTLRVSTDYLLGVTDVMGPIARDDGHVGKFGDRHSYLYDDEGFLTCVEVYNALSDEDRKCMTGIVKQYGINRNVLNTDGKPFASQKTGDDQ
ncbi:MAG: hypothetical protein LUD47_04720 [Clostridia bacterium]|nr:hypothetical protein [Clostridia bacterium]